MRDGSPLDALDQRAMQQLAAELVPLTPGTLGAARLQEQIRAAGLRTRRVRLRAGWTERGMVPLLAFRRQDGQPLALLPDARGHYQRCAPREEGMVPLTADEIAGLEPWGYCLYLSQTTGTTMHWRELQSALGPASRDLRLALLFSGAVALLGLALPIAARTLLGTASSTLYLPASLLILVAATTTTLLQFGRGLALLRAEVRAGTRVQTVLWERLLSLPALFFRRLPPGDLAARLDGLSTARTLLVPVVVSLTLNGLVALAALGMLLALEWRTGLVALAGGIVIGLTAVALARRAARGHRRLATRHNHLLGVTVGLISGIAKLRAARAEERAFAFWKDAFAGVRLASTQVARERRTAVALQAGIMPGAFIGVVAAVTVGWWRSSGEILAATMVVGLLSAALAALWGEVMAAARVVPSFDQLQPILETPTEPVHTGRAPGVLSGAFELCDIHFSYEQSPEPALAAVSMRVTAGSFVAVVGPSGSGKSTLVRLLLGFEAPQQGTINYDDQCLEELDRHAVRRQMGVVLQHATLIPGTIRSNIIGAAPLTEEDAWRAADLAGITSDIQALPMRMNTIITESGGAFSGGQRQRLLIARALARSPRILILDEATSALDQRVQAAVIRRIAGLQITRFVIAHRLSTVRHADWIYVLDHGRVVQEGGYDELITQPGLFHDLARRQLVIP